MLESGVRIDQAIAWASGELQRSSDTARLDAELLLAFVLKKNRTYLFTWPDKTLSGQDLDAFRRLVAQRCSGNPIAYLIGEQDFWTLSLRVAPCTLIPRGDTECLVETALEFLTDSPSVRVLDLGTGTGAIALSIASECPGIRVDGVDFQSGAVELARENAQRNGIRNAHFLQSDWFSAIDHNAYQLIVSNPPYIDPDDLHLGQGDVRFEPRTALVADNHGMADIEWIAQEAKHFLANSGWLMFEHGFDQGAKVRRVFELNGYQNIETRLDLNGLERVSLGQFHPG